MAVFSFAAGFTPLRMKAVVVDDHKGLAEMTSRCLGERLPVTMLPTISTFAEAMARLPKEAPDIVILDNRLDDGRGVDLVPALKGRLPQTRWLVYSAYASPHALSEAIALGVDGAVSKRAPTQVLDKAVMELLAGNRFFCEISSRALRECPETKALSPTERRILQHVAIGHEAKEIAAALGLAHKTVLNDLVSLRHKTGAESMVQLAEYAKAHGLATPW